MSIFYENYLKLCAARQESPTAVSKKIGLSNAAATGWKKGKKPSEVTLEKLAVYFGVAREDLTGEEQKEKPSTPEGVDLSSLSPEDAELVRRILGASEAKKNAIRELL
jgi:transcriptional regulator with XRE-family HTH domain